MAPSIDPAKMTPENIPYLLGILAAQMEQNTVDHTEIKAMLKDHDECLQIFKFSKCRFLPWLSRNKWILTVFVAIISFWFTSLDWLNRWLQWSFFPPKVGP